MSALAATSAMSSTSPASAVVASGHRQPDRVPTRVIYLTPERLIEEITAILGIRVSVKTLANWRSAGRGPAFVKVGRHVRYSLAEVQVWVRTCRRHRLEEDRGHVE